MYLAIDVGGTKTLIACLDATGAVLQTAKAETPQAYSDLTKTIGQLIDQLPQTTYDAACIAMPGRIDHEHGRVIAMGNRDWREVPVLEDCSRDIPQLAGVPMFLLNDAKLAGLGVAQTIDKKYEKMLYVSIGTGIGVAYTVGGALDKELADEEGGQMLLPSPEGKLEVWEDFASGRAISERYHQKASDITDQQTWEEIASMIGIGIVNLVTVLEPDVVVLGGGVGAHFGKFVQPLEAFVKRYLSPLTPYPAFIQAQNPEEAVLYGCYTHIKQKLA